jgi:hypothetical protein
VGLKRYAKISGSMRARADHDLLRATIDAGDLVVTEGI